MTDSIVKQGTMIQNDSVIDSVFSTNDSLTIENNLFGASKSLAIPATAQQLTGPIQGNSPNLAFAIGGQSVVNTPSATSNTSNTSAHKNNLKSKKLARRARSFKDDLFDKISLMRTPTNTLGRSQSPQSQRNKCKQLLENAETSKNKLNLETYIKDIINALKHFRDVVLKRKLEVLPGNGTVILETIASMFSVIQSYHLKNNEGLAEAMQQVYQSLGKLIKLCDEIMLDDNEECILLTHANVNEIVDRLEDAVKNVASITEDNLKENDDLTYEYENRALNTDFPNDANSKKEEAMGQRTSLPDISLTPKQNKTERNAIRISYSTENILRDTSPPPKPPLHNRSSNPPPLPPKKNNQTYSQGNEYNFINGLQSSPKYELDIDHLSIHSRSPDETSSQFSFNSTMNHSRDESDYRSFDHAYNLLNDEFNVSYQSTTKLSKFSNEIKHTSYSENDTIERRSHIQQSISTEITKSYSSVTETETDKERYETACNSSSSSNRIENRQTSSASELLSVDKLDDLIPPALPPKLLRPLKDRQPSLYDNFNTIDNNKSDSINELLELRNHQHHVYQWQSKHTSLIEKGQYNTHKYSSGGSSHHIDFQMEHPPPLPMKKKHILAYMEICSSSTRSIEQHRYTMHTFNLGGDNAATHGHTMMNFAAQTKDEMLTNHITVPVTTSTTATNKSWEIPAASITPPVSPKVLAGIDERVSEQQPSYQANDHKLQACDHQLTDSFKQKDDFSHFNLVDNHYDKISTTNDKINCVSNIIEEIDITPYLVFKKDNEDGPEIKGGYIDALIVYASRVQRVTDNTFIEAFITTYRTFVQPIEVVEKLIHRYTLFCCSPHNEQQQKAAKETFALLVRLVNDLTSTDLTGDMLTVLVEFVYQIVCGGQLYLAKLLRNKIVEKVTFNKELRTSFPYPLNMYCTVSNQPSLLDLKSVEIAEQMTLLDAELFQKIEIPEILLFVKEQCEDKSPNLNKFTEHFNKMSYWARSKILTLSCAKEREKHVIKFIKIMKHLRKINNYNSYLALLSALDSAPIRRLEWQKSITESLKEYCTLIDSSSSFRAYRQALAETQPPCIPYIGLVLQDLTFIHVGNVDFIKDGVVNFSKRWQQYHIIENMKRFKKCSYPFRRNERIIRFFEQFENFLGEEQMWEISETIKPRSKRTIVHK